MKILKLFFTSSLVVFLATSANLANSSTQEPLPKTGKASCLSLVVSGQQIHISDKALKHILEGNLGKNALGDTVIKGGLHTKSGLKTFLEQRPDIHLLGRFRVELFAGSELDYSDWYHESLNHYNGVIFVRMPESAFNRASLRALLASDLNHHGGYLWKTLFPEDLSVAELRSQILSLFQSREGHEDREWADAFTGEVNRWNEHPGYSLRIIVDKRSGQLITAYPTFQQREGNQYILPSAKSMILSQATTQIKFTSPADVDAEALVQSQNKDTYYRIGEFVFSKSELLHFLGFNFHNSNLGWFNQRNFRGWQKLSPSQKQDMLKFFLLNQEWANGDLNMMESLASLIVKDYAPHLVKQQSFELIDAIAQDQSFSLSDRLNFLLEVILNQRVHEDYFVEDIIWGKFLLAKVYDLAMRAEPGLQAMAIRAIERSALNWLNLQYFIKGLITPNQPTATLVARIFSGTWLQLSYLRLDYDDLRAKEESRSILPERFFFDRAREIEEKEWLYFVLMAEVERHRPGFFSEDILRKKFLVEFLNVLAARVALIGRANAQNIAPLTFGEVSVATQNILPLHQGRRIISSIHQKKSLLVDLLFKQKPLFVRWYEYLKAISKGDLRHVQETQKKNLSDEASQLLLEASHQLQPAQPPINLDRLLLVYPSLNLDFDQGNAASPELNLSFFRLIK